MSKRLVLVVCAVLASMTATGALAQSAGCTISHNQATCNLAAFRQTLNAAHTVKIEYRDRDKSTGMQLRELVSKLNKTIAQGDDKPDLTINVIPAQGNGVDVGSEDKEILELHVYAGDNNDQNLIWVETYIGQNDRPWPANVHATISQFLGRLAKN